MWKMCRDEVKVNRMGGEDDNGDIYMMRMKSG